MLLVPRATPGYGLSSLWDEGSEFMSSTYLSLHYHLVFSTKNREALIRPEWQSRVHEYLGGAVRRLGGSPGIVGGVSDHVHMLVGLKATHCLSAQYQFIAGCFRLGDDL